jgi:hypothetical protein
MKLILSMLLWISVMKGGESRDFRLFECDKDVQLIDESQKADETNLHELLDSFHKEIERSKNNEYNTNESFVLKVAPSILIDNIKRDSFFFKTKPKDVFLLSFYLVEKKINNTNLNLDQMIRGNKLPITDDQKMQNEKIIKSKESQNKLYEKFPSFVSKPFKCLMELKLNKESIVKRVILISKIPEGQFVNYKRIKVLPTKSNMQKEPWSDESFWHTNSKLLYFISKMHEDKQCIDKFSLDTISYDLDTNSFIFTDFMSFTKCGENYNVEKSNIYRSLAIAREHKEEKDLISILDPKTDVLIFSTVIVGLMRPGVEFDNLDPDLATYDKLNIAIFNYLKIIEAREFKKTYVNLYPINHTLFQGNIQKLYVNKILAQILTLALVPENEVTSEILSLLFLLVSSLLKIDSSKDDNAFEINYDNLIQIINTLALNKDEKLFQDVKIIQFLSYGGFVNNSITNELLHQSTLEILVNLKVLFCSPGKKCNLRQANNHKEVTEESNQIVGV